MRKDKAPQISEIQAATAIPMACALPEARVQPLIPINKIGHNMRFPNILILVFLKISSKFMLPLFVDMDVDFI
jgi:hypothetical protein